MLGEYKVGRCTRQCHALKRPLRDGEWYYSVVLESGDEYARRDYSAESWNGPPEGAIGWWKNRMPRADERRTVLAPPEVLVEILRKMEGDEARAKSRYLLALMLMRKKIVRPSVAKGESDVAEEGREKLRVEVSATGDVIEVPVCTISRSESDSLREELNELLYCEADEQDAEPDSEE